MLWHRQAIFESKGDRLSSSAECRIRTQVLRHQIASRLNVRWQTDWAIEDQAKNLSPTARPYDQRALSRLDPIAVIPDFNHIHTDIVLRYQWVRPLITTKLPPTPLCNSYHTPAAKDPRDNLRENFNGLGKILSSNPMCLSQVAIVIPKAQCNLRAMPKVWSRYVLHLGRSNIQMTLCHYNNFHHKNKTVLRPSLSWISMHVDRRSLYWNEALSIWHSPNHQCPPP